MLNSSPVIGSILGTAVGDAIGLPYEGLSRRRASRLLGPPDRHRFCFGRGMVSDDTEHTCMLAQSLIAGHGDLAAFERTFAWRLRFWLLGVPAGTGLATLRAIIRLWCGYPVSRCGVYSAGNGPAMRAAILGAAIADRGSLHEYVRSAARITHTDPKAEYGAWAIALAAQLAARQPATSPQQFLADLRTSLPDEGSELIELVEQAAESAHAGESTMTFAAAIGLPQRVTGYAYHSVPVALHAWFAHPLDLRAAVSSVVKCGGDTDSVAAMVGGIVGTAVGKEGIPSEWLTSLAEWPRTIAWMETLAERVTTSIVDPSAHVSVPRLPVAGILPRNIWFLVVVLFHGFRRLFPPY